MSERKALLDAVQSGAAERVRELLEADPSLAGTCDEDGVSAVLHALYRGRRDLADLCLAAGREPTVHESVCLGDDARVRELIGADPALVTVWSADGFSPLHLAAFFGQPGIAAMLLDAGAEISAPARNSMAVLPLNSAAAGQHLDVVNLLLERGADPDAGQTAGYTPLMSAAGAGNVPLIEALLRAGADATIAAADGRTAETLARERDHEEVIPLLRGKAE